MKYAGLQLDLDGEYIYSPDGEIREIAENNRLLAIGDFDKWHMHYKVGQLFDRIINGTDKE